MASGTKDFAPAPATASGPMSHRSGEPAPKLRSCVTCRARKVRCDKKSPCSNCARANIACQLPPLDRTPRWARRLERVANVHTATQDEPSPAVGKVMQRLHSLESLVKELNGQLAQARTAAGSSAGASTRGSSVDDTDHRIHSSSPDGSTSIGQGQHGRLVTGGANQSRYLDGLKMDTEGLRGEDFDSSGDEQSSSHITPSTQELNRTPSERHGFVFGHNIGSTSVSDLRSLHPLPSQIPFFLDVFSQNINQMAQVVHMPTVRNMVQDLRGDLSALTPVDEALMFSIYYSAITSMEDDEVMANFGTSKSELNLKYRIGLEHALAKADFLNTSDLSLLQAFAIFLLLVRRHDSPRFVWMMTGMAIRMAQALGLHRDGSHFPLLTPFEAELRRRVWWVVCMLDARSSEDQAMDLTISDGSFDTRVPLNINEDDLTPKSKVMPLERDGLTDMTLPLVWIGMVDVARQITALMRREVTASPRDYERLMDEFHDGLERRYLQHADRSDNIMYWVAVTVARLVRSKTTLFVYTPKLFSSPNEHLPEELDKKLFVAAIEVAEYNHALNDESACRQWRWIYQTYTHWPAIVYLLLAATRRPWAPMVERAWVALHSSWLIPAHSDMDNNPRIWVPLRKFMARTRGHRHMELDRLAGDIQAADRLETADRAMVQPGSPGPFKGEDDAEWFRRRWRQAIAAQSAKQTSPRQISPQSGQAAPSLSISGDQATHATPEEFAMPTHDFRSTTSGPSQFGPSPVSQTPLPGMSVAAEASSLVLGPGFGHWLCADVTSEASNTFGSLDVPNFDLSMDIDTDMNWQAWIESAKDAEFGGYPG